MNTSAVRAAVVALVLAGSALALAGAPVEPAPQPNQPVVPYWAFKEIVSESNKFVQEQFAGPRPSPNPLVNVQVAAVRSNTFLIALAAQNRLAVAGPDAAKFVALRDTAVKLARALHRNPRDSAEVLRLAALLARYPDLPVADDVNLAPVRLRDTFDHDDVAGVFGGCGNKTQRLELQLIQFKRQKAPFTQDQAERVEVLAYKLALIAEILREMDDFLPTIRKTTAEDRQEWVRLGGLVREHSWQLADTARTGDQPAMKHRLGKLNDACSDCHVKFRDCN